MAQRRWFQRDCFPSAFQTNKKNKKDPLTPHARYKESLFVEKGYTPSQKNKFEAKFGLFP
eukprot:6477108-Amphidinium_carterae.2